MPDINLITTAHDHWQFEPSIERMSEDVYRAVPALNPSAIVEGIRDPAPTDVSAVKQSFEGNGFDATDAMDRGTLAHLLLLEPHRVADEVVVWQGGIRNSKAYTAFEQENEGRLILRDKDYELTSNCCRQLNAISRLRELLGGLEYEQALFSKWHNIFTKGRVDGLAVRNRPRMIDIKTTDAGISDDAVERTIRNMHYREKMAFYRKIYAEVRHCKPDDIECHLIFIKLTPPYGVNIRELGMDTYQFGWDRCQRVMESIQKHLVTNEWPIWVSDGMSVLSSWELPDIDAEINYGASDV